MQWKSRRKKVRKKEPKSSTNVKEKKVKIVFIYCYPLCKWLKVIKKKKILSIVLFVCKEAFTKLMSWAAYLDGHCGDFQNLYGKFPRFSASGPKLLTRVHEKKFEFSPHLVFHQKLLRRRHSLVKSVVVFLFVRAAASYDDLRVCHLYRRKKVHHFHSVETSPYCLLLQNCAGRSPNKRAGVK